ncbi:MAG: amino acid adenylation domain-containing protein, partial [bacterium]|nr:amino acid adenylation domain-containing protein [bacterium]
KTNALEAFENQDFQLDHLVDSLDLPRDTGRNPLFDALFALLNVEAGEVEIPGIRFEPYELENPVSQFDITLQCTEAGETLGVALEYSTRLFKRETMERFYSHFVNLIEACTEKNGEKIGNLKLFSAAEEEQILYEFNSPASGYPTGKTLHGLLEEQVEKAPHSIALAASQGQVTYKRLNRNAFELARRLQALGVGPGTIVGLMIEPSLEMVFALLGILKAGGAYMPMAPDYPGERVRFMLEDSGADTVVTTTALANRIPQVKNLVLLESGIYNQDEEKEENLPGAGDPAYVIYTSGSTGRPKGVVVEHRSVVAYMASFFSWFDITPGDTVVQLISVTFDAFVEELYPLLLRGGRVALPNPEEKTDIPLLADFILRHRVTMIDCTPLLLKEINRLPQETFKNLRIIISGGDVLKKEYVDQLVKTGNVYNTYGPTESTVCATYYHYKTESEVTHSIPIGKPIANYGVYILDSNHNILPVGLPGEICITGAGITRGYLNRPELTHEKYCCLRRPLRGERQGEVHPGPPIALRAVNGDTRCLYRTGDLGRWLADGTIEFMGRIDNQVKIRGFRIELGEIENALLSQPDIGEAVVVVRKDTTGNDYLVGYYVYEGVQDGDARLREALSALLPGYMIPTYLVALESLPRSVSGKIDAKALPEPIRGRTGADGYEAPRNENERILTQIWSEILGVEKVGINDSFFDLGGDSIKAIQVVSRLRNHRLTLSVADLFRFRSIGKLGDCIKSVARKTRQESIEGDVPLTAIQRWFFQENFTRPYHWNQAVMLFKKQGFDETAVENSLGKLAAHHDALRMVYTGENGCESVKGSGEHSKVSQYNRGVGEEPGTRFDYRVMDFRDCDEYERKIETETNRLQAGFDLNRGPLLKALLFKTSNGHHLLLVIHHLVVDGVSWRILLEDFTALYEGFTKETPGKEVSAGDIALPDKTASFKEWSQALREYIAAAGKNSLKKEAAFWNKQQDSSFVPLPKDMVCESNPLKDTQTASLFLDENETRRLLKDVNPAYNTGINDILLTALALTVSRWIGAGKVVIHLEGHGREAFDESPDISRTVGWFTSQYPVILPVGKEDVHAANNPASQKKSGGNFDGVLSFQLRNIKETLRSIPRKGIGYGLIKYLVPEVTGETLLTGEIAPEIGFNYLGRLDGDSSHDLFTMSPLSTGDSQSPESKREHALEISGIITNGRLSMDFN